MTAIYTANQSKDTENDRKNPAQGIDIEIMDRIIRKEFECQIRSRRDMEHTKQCQHRTASKNHPALLRRAKRGEETDEDEDDTRMKILKHRHHRILSHNNLRRVAKAAS